MGKIVRQLGIKPQLLPGDGVDKTQRFGVQTLPVQAGDAVVGAVHRVPCHRVVTKEGRISPAFGPGPDNRQARRLREEGVQVRDGFVDMEEFQWKKWIF